MTIEEAVKTIIDGIRKEFDITAYMSEDEEEKMILVVVGGVDTYFSNKFQDFCTEIIAHTRQEGKIEIICDPGLFEILAEKQSTYVTTISLPFIVEFESTGDGPQDLASVTKFIASKSAEIIETLQQQADVEAVTLKATITLDEEDLVQEFSCSMTTEAGDISTEIVFHNKLDINTFAIAA